MNEDEAMEVADAAEQAALDRAFGVELWRCAGCHENWVTEVADLCTECIVLTQTTSFQEWMRSLRKEQAKDGVGPYGENDCWLTFWRDNYTPRQALNEDYSNA